jgi:hypothetical protein
MTEFKKTEYEMEVDEVTHPESSSVNNFLVSSRVNLAYVTSYPTAYIRPIELS